MITHLTTSYPTLAEPEAGRFVAALVDAERRAVGENGDLVSVIAAPNGVLTALASPLRWPRLLMVVRGMGRQLRQTNAEFVHAHWWPCAYIAQRAGWGRAAGGTGAASGTEAAGGGEARRRLIVTAHGSDIALALRGGLIGRILRRVCRTTLNRCDVVCAPSRALARDIALIDPAIEVRVIRHGIDVPPLAQTSSDVGASAGNDLGTGAGNASTKAGANLGADADNTAGGLCFVGSLAPHKGADLLPRILRDVRKHGIDDTLHIFGTGPLRAELTRELAEELATGRCVLHGERPHREVMEVMAACRAVLCPSLREGYGLACQEARSLGVPVVAFAVGGLIEQLDGSMVLAPSRDATARAESAEAARSVAPSAGELVTPRDVDQFASTLRDVLADTARRNALRQFAKAHRDALRSWDDCAHDYLALLRRMTA